MAKSLCLWLVLASFALLSSPSQASSHDFTTRNVPDSSLYDELKDTGANYEITGTVCEEVARLELHQRFPKSHYEIKTGVVYSHRGRVVGELDVVVFKNSDHHVELVGEVKCWANLDHAKSKALKQKKRFLNSLASLGNIEFYLKDHPEVTYEQKQFQSLSQFILISQQGGETSGFDMALHYSLDELMKMRDSLMQCQEQGLCRRHSF